MAIVLVVAQQKGGAGKTMLAASLAAALAGRHRVTLLDIDPQRSLARWNQLRIAAGRLPQIGFSDVSGWRVKGELDRLAHECDIVIVDTPPQIDSNAARAIRAASLVLVPVQPSLPDLWASEATLNMAAGEGRPLAIVMNRVSARSDLRLTIEADLRGRGLAILPAALGERRAYAQAFAQGMGVNEAQPRSVAAAETAAVARAVLEIAR